MEAGTTTDRPTGAQLAEKLRWLAARIKLGFYSNPTHPGNPRDDFLNDVRSVLRMVYAANPFVQHTLSNDLVAASGWIGSREYLGPKEPANETEREWMHWVDAAFNLLRRMIAIGYRLESAVEPLEQIAAGLAACDLGKQGTETIAPSAVDLDSIDSGAYLSEADLSIRCDVNRNSLRTALRKWRPKHHDNSWQSVPNPKPREPRYLYRFGAVRTLIAQLHSGTGQLPAKK